MITAQTLPTFWNKIAGLDWLPPRLRPWGQKNPRLVAAIATGLLLVLIMLFARNCSSSASSELTYFTVKRGDFVGRPDIVHIGGANGADYQIHWRVDKVRDGDVVFIREDPAQPNIPPASRVISLHPEQDQNERLN